MTGENKYSNNLFEYATSELSQDAFIAWFLSHLMEANRQKDPAITKCAADFMKRHAKILTRLAKRITAGTVIFFAAAAAALRIFPSANADVNEILMTYLPYFLFVMYILNCGRTITQAMFMNCDHSMISGLR